MSINVTEALNKETYAYKCWYNYNYGKNTLGISEADYASIIGKWKDSLNTWSEFAKDENKYEISDSELDDYRKKGKEAAKDATGYAGGGKCEMIARGTADATAAAVGTASQKLGAKVLGKSMAKHVAVKGSEKAAEGTTKAASKAANFIVAAPLALATAIAYLAKKANKEQKEATDTLKNEVLPEVQASLDETQEYMDDKKAEVLDLSEEAEDKNGEANNEIKQKKTNFDAERRIYDRLMDKKTAGEKLTKEEEQWLKEHIPAMQEISDDINEIFKKTSEEVNDLYDQMGEKQEDFDDAAENIAEADGVTKYAESFDGTTRTMCYVEGAAQALNALSGTKAAYEAASFAASGTLLFGATAWAWAFAAMGAAGAAISGVASAEQFKWAGEVGQEIDLRKDTQDLSDETTDAYDEHLEVYEGAMGIVEDMELEIPDDLDVPEGVTDDGETAEEPQVDTVIAEEPETEDDKKKEKV